MLGKTPNKVYDPFIKVRLGYQNPERLKKAITAQSKMYHGEMLQSTKLKIDSPDSEETLEDAEESRLKMRNKMVQLDYGKLNALYETFVPQKESSVEQTYLSIPSTSNICSESNEFKSDLQILKMPKESKMLKMFEIMGLAINDLRDRIDVTLLEDRKRRWMFDSENSLRVFYKTDKHELLENKIEKISSDSKDIQANLLKRIIILENDFKRSQAQSIDFELKIQHQKEKMACDVSWKSRLSKLSDENMLLKTQLDSVVQERENIKLEYQNVFNSIKATRAQHQQEVNKLIESISQKRYAYGYVHSKNQDLLMVISELKDKLKTFEKGKSVNIKVDKFVTLGKLLCVTPLSNNIAVQGVGSSNSVRRPKSKDTKLKNRVLKNTNAKSSSTHVWKVSSSVRIGSNKRETKNSNVCQSNTSILNTKNVNAVNDGSNIVCVSCGKDVFLLCHEKCVARYALFIDSWVKRALFTFPILAKSRNFGATLVVAKSRFSVAKTLTTTNKVSNASLIFPDSKKKLRLDIDGELERHTSTCYQRFTLCANPIVRLNDIQSQIQADSLLILQELRNIVLESHGLYMRHISSQVLGYLLHSIRVILIYTDVFFHSIPYKEPTNKMIKRMVNILKVKDKEEDTMIVFLIEACMYSESTTAAGAFNEKRVYFEAVVRQVLLIGRGCHDGFINAASIVGYYCFMVLLLFLLDTVDTAASKDEAPDLIINFINQVQRSLKAQILKIRTNNGTEFKNKKLRSFYVELDTRSSSSIIVEDSDAPQIVTSSEKPITQESSTSVLESHYDEQIQEDVTELNGNTILHSFKLPEFEEVESSLNYQDPSDMHEFHQQHRYTDKWTKNHPIKQVITDPSKPVQTRNRL
ncbi:hypothetical protein Tco_0952348 [Tanacetum coccineum]|uniref:Uncharacterized protein n=1 Tax=Tanacetum coccineum TaxID=301880 RepID=A0ABQ5DZM4_9ASTR